MANVSTLVRILLGGVSICSTVVLLFVLPMFAILLSACCRLLSILLSNRSIFETVDDFIMDYFERLIVFCCETTCPHEIVLHGHTRALDFLAERNTDRVIYISNHTAAADWIVSEFLGLRAKALPRLRFVLKNSLRYSPIYGWFLRQRNCIYVRRGGGEMESFRKQASRLGPSGLFRPGAWLIIFPEGTRIRDPVRHPEVLAANREFASAKNLRTYEYLLTPKHRGLYLCIEGMTGRYQEKEPCWLLNATVFYEPSGDPQKDWVWEAGNTEGNIIRRPRVTSIFGLLTGASHRIHVYLDLISLNSTSPGDRTQSYFVSKPPTDELGFSKWLAALYADKDIILQQLFASLHENMGVSFGRDVCTRPLHKPYAETVPHALLGFAFLYFYFSTFGFWFAVYQFTIETVLCFIALFVYADDSPFIKCGNQK